MTCQLGGHTPVVKCPARSAAGSSAADLVASDRLAFADEDLADHLRREQPRLDDTERRREPACQLLGIVERPRHRYSFGVVKEAEARSDLEVLANRGRRALRVHLGADVAAGLEQTRGALAETFASGNRGSSKPRKEGLSR